ncbi:30S ribosomal protein S12 methylthiotransferase accessory factor YcaO [Thiomicrospira sp. R3]|uniref:30S ribosomal protein S12 methylthiotransferase accessory factor YcaO n=1 Tax=Thiomicrospira sp. R3 TaxID=3035472 RepID=UPI00259B3C87|nr:30S ribosomal protein S12 methylthiotransferase accessory factor YcaO [Thiomicrospira sp. R3]WFE68444.1 30S ribosomal protein S12 methylthiotransferase accessory factor YcaO [Thiomicrospira sp. R3]
MSEVTFIKGKDQSLENSIAFMQTTLIKQGFDINEVKWLNSVANIYSLHIHDRACPGLFTNGKGASRKATLASALGEFLERLSTNYFFSDYYLEPALKDPSLSGMNDWLYYPNEKSFALSDFKQCLNADLWSIYDPHQELQADQLLSFNDNSERIRAIEMRHAQTDEVIYVPMNLLSNLYASNGLSAGNNQQEAAVQGLSEIFERWVKNKILKENICLPEIPDQVIARFPSIQRSLQDLRDQGLEVSVRDASLGGQFPVMNVTLFDPKQGRCFASFGAHPLFEVALERTLTESLQGRHLGFLDGFQVPSFDQQAIAEDENLENHFIDSSGLINARFIADQADFEFVDWNWDLTTEQQWQWLVELAKEQGFDVYIAHYAQYNFHTCRIIAPGMSEVYPMDELLVKNQNDGRKLRQALGQFAINQQPGLVLALLDEIGFSDHQGVASLIGLMPDAGCVWNNIKIIDLRFWLEVYAKDFDAAYQSLQVCKAYVDPEKPMAVVYEAMQFALDIELDSLDYAAYRSGMKKLFGEQIIDKVQAHLNGEQCAWGLALGPAAFEQSHRHQALWQVYQRAHQAKISQIRVSQIKAE